MAVSLKEQAKMLAQSMNRKGSVTVIDRYARTRELIEKHMENGDRALIIDRSVYNPDPAVVVTFTKTFPRFAIGYIKIRSTSKKIPYTLNYATLIAHDLDDTSHWENGSSIYE